MRDVVAMTFYSEEGEVTGALLSNGSMIQAAETPKTARWWDETQAAFETGEVAWCGSTRKHAWSHTRGELLGDYAKLISPEMREIAGKLQVKVATWAKQMPKVEVTGREDE